MCLAVCNKKIGGCGYLGDDKEWTKKEDHYLCPHCNQDYMYFLHHYNLEAVVDISILKKAQNMLESHYADLKGQALQNTYSGAKASPA